MSDLQGGQIDVCADNWPTCFYKDGVYDPENPEKGLFCSKATFDLHDIVENPHHGVENLHDGTENAQHGVENLHGGVENLHHGAENLHDSAENLHDGAETSANQPSPRQYWPVLDSDPRPPATPNKVPNWLGLY